MSQLYHTDGDLVLLTGSPTSTSSADPYSGTNGGSRHFFWNDMYPKDRQITPLPAKETVRGEGAFAITKKGEYRHFSSRELVPMCREPDGYNRYLFTKSDEFLKMMWNASHYEVD